MAKRPAAVTETANQTAIPALIPQPGGRGALFAGGVPGNNGGRPTDAFKALMRSLADRAARALAVSKILDDPSDAMYLPAAKWAAEQGYGKPEQPVSASGAITLEIVRRALPRP